VTYGIATLVSKVVGLRVNDNEEEVGLDISEHGERAYT
jgi:Amt family ammonium transporter